jgi:hypothetical protein
MTPYILDTDIRSLYQQGHPKVRHQCRARPTRHLAITVISVEEQLSGWYTAIRRARSPDDLALANPAQLAGGGPRLAGEPSPRPGQLW